MSNWAVVCWAEMPTPLRQRSWIQIQLTRSTSVNSWARQLAGAPVDSTFLSQWLLLYLPPSLHLGLLWKCSPAQRQQLGDEQTESAVQFKCGPFLLNSNVPHCYNYFCWKIKNKVSSGKPISKAVRPWIRGVEPKNTIKKQKKTSGQKVHLRVWKTAEKWVSTTLRLNIQTNDQEQWASHLFCFTLADESFHRTTESSFYPCWDVRSEEKVKH